MGLLANDDWHCLRRLSDPIEANLIRGMLETHGIPARVTGEGLVGAYSGIPKVCDVRVHVPAHCRGEAEAVMADYDQAGAPAGPPWNCASCGEQNDPGFEVCWQCGSDPKATAGTDGRA